MQDDTNLKKIPYIVAALRIVLTPLIFYTFLLEFGIITILLFIIAALTDIIDGRLAKILQVTSSSPLEAYLDAIADFVFVTVSFLAFSIKGIYPFWIPIVLVAMFLFFILTSNQKHPIYDPIGKYYGSFLIATVGITLLLPISIVYDGVFLSFLCYTMILIVYRTYFLLKHKRMDLNKGSK